MNFEEYQNCCKNSALYKVIGKSFVYPALGLGGEAGEVLEKVKKIFRDNSGEVTDQIRVELAKELGDVLWYVATLCTEFGLSLEEVAETNIAKLSSRLDRGKISGSGDNR